MDSDAIFEVNIDYIIRSYDSVFVKSFMSNTYLFNGLIATYPKNPIVYDALRHAYETEDIDIQKNYHYLCEELWRIYNRYNFTNISETYYMLLRLWWFYNLDRHGEKVVSHYFQTKKIPFNIEGSYESHNSVKNKNIQL